MSAEQYVKDFCYDWVNLIVNARQPGDPSQAGDTPIIFAYQDAPAPTGTYIVISHPSVSRQGTSYMGSPSVGSALVPYASDFTARVEFWQVGGLGEHLRIIDQDSDFQSSKDFLYLRKISLYGRGEINYIPRVEEKQTIQECRMELNFGFAVSRDDALGWIDTVEFVNQIGE